MGRPGHRDGCGGLVPHQGGDPVPSRRGTRVRRLIARSHRIDDRPIRCGVRGRGSRRVWALLRDLGAPATTHRGRLTGERPTVPVTFAVLLVALLGAAVVWALSRSPNAPDPVDPDRQE